MADTTCGWCNRLTLMKAVAKLSTPDQHLLNSNVQGVYKCVNCEQISIATEYDQSYRHHLATKIITDDADKYTWGPFTNWLPKPEGPRAYPDVPGDIASLATEATQCLAGGSYRAVGSLARAVIEATAKEQKFTMHGIAAKIDAMAEKKLLRPLVADQAHEIRHFGNEMAHGDLTIPTTKEEAEEIVALMNEVLREVYQAPAELARVKAAREARKTAGKTENDE